MKINLHWSAVFWNFKALGTKKYMQISKETKVTYKITAIIMVLHFSKGTLKTKRGWNRAIKILKERNFHPKNLYLHKPPFKCKGEISENMYWKKLFSSFCLPFVFPFLSVRCLCKCLGPFFFSLFFIKFLVFSRCQVLCHLYILQISSLPYFSILYWFLRKSS